MVSANELSGKKVVSLKGDEIGEIKDVDFDITKWQVTSMVMKLSSKAAVSLGYKKTFGSYDVCMPISIISSVGDVITINKTLLELASGADMTECPPKHIRRGIKVSI